jgi:hypothetical protein
MLAQPKSDCPDLNLNSFVSVDYVKKMKFITNGDWNMINKIKIGLFSLW